jgi:hypothetical protein
MVARPTPSPSAVRKIGQSVSKNIYDFFERYARYIFMVLWEEVRGQSLAFIFSLMPRLAAE